MFVANVCSESLNSQFFMKNSMKRLDSFKLQYLDYNSQMLYDSYLLNTIIYSIIRTKHSLLMQII